MVGRQAEVSNKLLQMRLKIEKNSHFTPIVDRFFFKLYLIYYPDLETIRSSLYFLTINHEEWLQWVRFNMV